LESGKGKESITGSAYKKEKKNKYWISINMRTRVVKGGEKSGLAKREYLYAELFDSSRRQGDFAKH